MILSRPKKLRHIFTYSIEVIKYLSNLISPILAILINRSVCTGTFPQILKIVRVVPVFKSGGKQDLKVEVHEKKNLHKKSKNI